MGKATDTIQGKMIISKRKLTKIGNSLGITLSKKWLDHRKLSGKEVKEVLFLANDVILLLPTDLPKEIVEEAKKMLKALEEAVNNEYGTTEI